MSRRPGTPKTGGRQKGSVNKIQKDLREEILEVHQRLGGTEGMLEWARQSETNQRIFYGQILPKLLPREVKAEVNSTNSVTFDEGTLKKMALEILKK